MSYGISIDIGTSGSRAHAVDLKDGRILSTAVTECHPLPGANIMDHLTFCINVGTEMAQKNCLWMKKVCRIPRTS